MENLKNKLILRGKSILRIIGIILFILMVIGIFFLIFGFILKAFVLPNCIENRILVGYAGNQELYTCEGIYEIYKDNWGNIVFFGSVLSTLYIIHYFLWVDIKKIRIQYVKKVFIYLSLGFLLLQTVFLGIDIYNFTQLKKAKIILNDLPLDERKFYSLQEFNESYEIDIQPIYKCYDVSNYNGEEPYIFGFQLHSLPFKFYYGTSEYAYPKYDKPYWKFCVGGCFDRNKFDFKETISHSCEK